MTVMFSYLLVSLKVAALLRANDGTGRLRTGADGISLPIATADDLKIQPMQVSQQQKQRNNRSIK